MDNMVWAYFRNLIVDSSIINVNVMMPSGSSLESFLLNRESGKFLLSYDLTSLPILKTKRSSDKTYEKGIHSLYMGYPYMNFALLNGTFLYEPVILFPVNIIVKNSMWYITNNKEMNIMLNYRLIYHYFESVGLKYNFFNKEFEDLNQFGENKLAGILAYMKENNLNIERNLDMNSDLCLISPAFALLKDYEKILSDNISSCLFESLECLPKETQERDISCDGKDLFLISHLNPRQVNAAAAACILNRVLITGSKGSGKKETVLNITSDSLCRNKNVLIVSEDKVALLSISERLRKIDNKILLLSNNYNIFRKMKIQMNIKTEKQKDILSQIKSKSENIEKKLKAIKDMEEVLYKIRPFGLSLQEMYSKADAITSKEDFRYEAFKTYQRKNTFCEFTYSQIKTSVAGIEDKTIDDYREYRNLIEDYPNLLMIKTESSKWEDLYENKDEIKAAFSNMYINIKELENFSDIAFLCLEKNFAVTNSDILNMANKIINNSKDDSPSESNKLVHFIKYKSKKSNEVLKRKIEEKSETLSVYYDMMANYMDIITSLKEVLDQGFYNELIEDALKGIDISALLHDLLDAVGKYGVYKKFNDVLSKLSDLDRLILSYIYENNEPPFNEKELLSHIVEFSIISHIKDIESQSFEKKSLFTYMRYNELKESIESYAAEKNNLTYDYINQIWNSRLKELYDSAEYISFKKDIKNNLPIKILFGKYSDILLTMFPIILAPPEKISGTLPLKDMFDNVIYIDSSQISIESAVPSLYRGKKLIVSGDTLSITKENSLLNKCINKFYNVILNYNYISDREDILEFQNNFFYKNSIVISPNLKRKSQYKPQVELINIEDAIDIISHIIMDGNLSRIGMAVFCEKDTNYINKELAKREIYISKDCITNAEQCFYTERDIVFIFAGNFSKIVNNYKYNMLNIALAAAKNKIYLINQDSCDETADEYKKYTDIINLPKHTVKLPKNKEWLINQLISCGFNISCDLGYPPNIDIGIFDKSHKYVLGIIFDKEISYPVSLIRFYESRGWRIYRIWSRDLFQDKISVINSVIKMIGPFKSNKI